MKLKIVEHWIGLSEKTIWTITIKEEYSDLWYKEIMRRSDLNYPCYDIYEIYECWEIWLPHLIEMLNFIKK